MGTAVKGTETDREGGQEGQEIWVTPQEPSRNVNQTDVTSNGSPHIRRFIRRA